MFATSIVDIRKCPRCNREFVVPIAGREEYVYKLRNSKKKGTIDYFCSWTCYKEAKSNELNSKPNMTIEEQNWLKWARGE